MFKVYCDCKSTILKVCKSTILKVVRKVVKVVDVVFKGECGTSTFGHYVCSSQTGLGWNVVTKGLGGIENKPKLIALISQLGCRNLVIKGEIHFVNYLIKDVC